MTVRIVRRQARIEFLPRGNQFGPEHVGEQRVSLARAIPQSALRRTPLVTLGADGGSLGRTQVSAVSATSGFRSQQVSG